MLRIGLLLTIALSTTGCWHLLPPGDITTPEYWSDYFLDKYAAELVVGELEAGPEPLESPRTVLLITGVTIRASWFDPIVARLERDGFNPVVYEPPELLSYDLFEATEDLAEVIERVQAESGQARIDILAECTGGVIARHYIQSMGGDAHVARMVTFVSPQAGIDKAPWAEAIAGWPALRDLSPGSAFLRAVNDPPLPESVDFTSIYTCTDEYIQPYSSSIIPGATNIGFCDRPLGHFETFFDPEVYGVMHGALTRPLSDGALDAEPEAAEPEAAEPEAAEPEAAEPEAAEPDAAEPEGIVDGQIERGDDPPSAPSVNELPVDEGGCSAAQRPTSGGSGWAILFGMLGLGAIRRR